MIFNILDNTTELWMTKNTIGEIFSSCRVTLYKNPPDQTVCCPNYSGTSSLQQNILRETMFLKSLCNDSWKTQAKIIINFWKDFPSCRTWESRNHSHFLHKCYHDCRRLTSQIWCNVLSQTMHCSIHLYWLLF